MEISLILLILSLYIISIFLLIQIKQNDNKIFLLLSLLITFIFAVLIGFRDYNVGADTKTYLKKVSGSYLNI
jgi:hypothetical protein